MENKFYDSKVRDAINKWEKEHKGYVAFTQWCDVYKTELAHLSTLSKDTKCKFAFMLLDHIGIAKNDRVSLHALLACITETEEENSKVHWSYADLDMQVRDNNYKRDRRKRVKAGLPVLTEVFYDINPWIAPRMINRQLLEKLPDVFRTSDYAINHTISEFGEGAKNVMIDIFIGKRISLFGHSYCRIQIGIDTDNFIEAKVGFRDSVQWCYVSIGEPFYKDGLQKHTEVPDNMEDFLLTTKELFVIEKSHDNGWNADGVLNHIVAQLAKFKRQLEKEVSAKRYNFYKQSHFDYLDLDYGFKSSRQWNWKNLF